MPMLALILAAFLVLPVFLGHVHTRFSRRTPPLLLYFRYFMLFNMLIAGIIVALRVLYDGPQAAVLSGWAYSPVFQLYGIAILSMIVMGILTIFSRKPIMLAAPILWLTFLILATILHAEEIAEQIVRNVAIIYVHIGYNLLVCAALILFILKLKHRFDTYGDF